MSRPRPVSFYATKVVREPTRVSFRTKDGETVTFKAVKGVEQRVKVKFIPKKK